jgi:hypothetical protein
MGSVGLVWDGGWGMEDADTCVVTAVYSWAGLGWAAVGGIAI